MITLQSSLTLSLLRCIFTEGSVYYDGLLTSSLNLDALRSKITIIPQIVPKSIHSSPFVLLNSLFYVARIAERLIAREPRSVLPVRRRNAEQRATRFGTFLLTERRR